ncbi:hypothetical protein AYI68_g6549 [Smittium mucronatum]|uniref:Uncharacterized protein n=1 Tax=Smittium mucronatum TaxID=133383 RepID=A0A1R0GR72_9FUNG|nr:hypothetical protein AYI68_g6549 [Smittium mucronatum]
MKFSLSILVYPLLSECLPQLNIGFGHENLPCQGSSHISDNTICPSNHGYQSQYFGDYRYPSYRKISTQPPKTDDPILKQRISIRSEFNGKSDLGKTPHDLSRFLDDDKNDLGSGLFLLDYKNGSLGGSKEEMSEPKYSVPISLDGLSFDAKEGSSVDKNEIHNLANMIRKFIESIENLNQKAFSKMGIVRMIDKIYGGSLIQSHDKIIEHFEDLKKKYDLLKNEINNKMSNAIGYWLGEWEKNKKHIATVFEILLDQETKSSINRSHMNEKKKNKYIETIEYIKQILNDLLNSKIYGEIEKLNI